MGKGSRTLGCEVKEKSQPGERNTDLGFKLRVETKMGQRTTQ